MKNQGNSWWLYRKKIVTLHTLSLSYQEICTVFKQIHAYVALFANLTRQTIMTIPRIQAMTRAIPDRTGRLDLTFSMNASLSIIGVRFIIVGFMNAKLVGNQKVSKKSVIGFVR